MCYLEPRLPELFNAFDTAIGSSRVNCLSRATEAKKFATQGSEIGGMDQPQLSDLTTTYMVVNPPQ